MQANFRDELQPRRDISDEAASQSNDMRWMLDYELRAALALQRGDSAEQIVEAHSSPRERAYHLSRYEYAANFVRDKRVLDFACGSGYGSYRLARAGAARVLGADIDAEAIRYSSLRYRAPNLFFHLMDAGDLLPSQSFDVVISFETIEHVPDPENFLANIAQSLTAEGRAFISTPIRWSGSLSDRPANPFHLREWSIEEFSKLLFRYFSVVEPVLYQGGLPRHSGRSGLKQIARHIKRRFNGLWTESSLKLETALKPAETLDLSQWSRPTYMVVPCSAPRQ